MLTGFQIRDMVASGQIVINDFDEKRLNPNSYNLRLHNKLVVYEDHLLDIKTITQAKKQEIIIPAEGFILEPDRLYLARTMEHTESHNHIPKIEGRSSLARMGLFIHITAGFGDIGFCGTWTLELHCVQPIRIYPFIEICQISYFEPVGFIGTNKYQGNYQNQKEIQSSKFEIKY